MEDRIEIRKEKLIGFLNAKKDWIIYSLMFFFIWVAANLRIKNLSLLKDVTTGNYIPLALDPFIMLRYAKIILNQGSLMTMDTMRYVPLGLDLSREVFGVSYLVVYLYKFLGIFNGNLTLEFVHVIYPVIFFVLSMVSFFFLMNELFRDKKISLIGTALLSFIPTFLQRTVAGFSDKESVGIFFIFLTFLFFVKSLKSKTVKRSALFGFVAGCMNGLLAMLWGGVILSVLVISTFMFFNVLFGRLNRKNLVTYVFWFLPFFYAAAISTQKYGGLLGFIQSAGYGISVFVLLYILIHYLFSKHNLFGFREKFKKFPLSFLSLIFTLLISIVAGTLLFGLGFAKALIQQFIHRLFFTQSTRWILTVAESHQAFMQQFVGSTSFIFVLFVLFGSVLLFYNMMNGFDKKIRIKLTLAYSVFIFMFFFSKYSDSSLLNGLTFISKFFYIGSVLIFLAFLLSAYFYAYIKKNSWLDAIRKIDNGLLFSLVMFIVFTLSFRTAIRLMFVYSTVAAMFSGYFIGKLLSYERKNSKMYYKLFMLLLVIFALVVTLIPFMKNVAGQTPHIGPSYNQQWQVAMSWVRENTKPDSVFAHWWDYGYWVQQGGERATITDGGNLIGVWNHFMGRYVLTGHIEEEALIFLKTHDATHLLIISDDIGKYPAYSSIGADANYDRYSYISTFALDPSQTTESRNNTLYLYRGSFVLDNDVIYGDKFFAEGRAGILGFILPVSQNGDLASLSKPEVLIISEGQQERVPLNCIFVDGREVLFSGEGLNGCLIMIPVINENGVNPAGAALYVSEEVRNTLFTQLYLYGTESDNFKLAYSDESNLPLSIYNGRLIGPLKIWEISYPENIVKNEIYLGSEWPDIKAKYAN